MLLERSEHLGNTKQRPVVLRSSRQIAEIAEIHQMPGQPSQFRMSFYVVPMCSDQPRKLPTIQQYVLSGNEPAESTTEESGIGAELLRPTESSSRNVASGPILKLLERYLAYPGETFMIRLQPICLELPR